MLLSGERYPPGRRCPGTVKGSTVKGSTAKDSTVKSSTAIKPAPFIKIRLSDTDPMLGQ